MDGQVYRDELWKGPELMKICEWLNNQAAGGYISYDPASRKYALPVDAFFAEEEGPVYLTSGFYIVASVWNDGKNWLMP
jgi:hypothetical protein